MKTIDCRKMACPAPVVTTKRALEEAGRETIQVLLDEGAPRENVTRFATNRGYIVAETAVKGGFALTISSAGATPAQPVVEKAKAGKTVMLLGTDQLGEGPEELGRLLMKNFIITLLDVAELPDRMLFVNTGVHLTTEGSEVLEALDTLGNRGVEVMSCGICLDFFGKKDKLRAGVVTNMFTIAESMLQAGLVIKL
ncbi:MAG: sulfurtransferase-like selenium metabolism protein YedF [Geobacter sp.]|nr:sulfurtransferase-like selenium metabolism protein YedF [Geobacter sp.]